MFLKLLPCRPTQRRDAVADPRLGIFFSYSRSGFFNQGSFPKQPQQFPLLASILAVVFPAFTVFIPPMLIYFSHNFYVTLCICLSPSLVLSSSQPDDFCLSRYPGPLAFLMIARISPVFPVSSQTPPFLDKNLRFEVSPFALDFPP